MKKKLTTLFLFLLVASVLSVPIVVKSQIDRIVGTSLSRGASYTLTVTGSGAGTGTVTSDVYAIDCTSTAGTESGTCSNSVPIGTVVTLTATPAATFMFNGWTGGGCAGTGTCVITITADVTVDAEFVLSPKPDYLIGWYRFNEGSGLVANNSATDGSSGGGLLPDLTVKNASGGFWTDNVGFASNTLANGNYAHSTIVARNFGGTANNYSCYGIFCKLNAATATGGHPFNFHNSAIGSEAAFFTSNFGVGNDYNGTMILGGSTSTAANDVKAAWVFLFVGSDRTLRVIRNSDGTMITGAAVMSQGTPISLIYLNVGGRNGTGGGLGSPFGGVWGDTIVYNFTTLTDAQWAMWYDTYRSRYGMPARSGW